MTDEPRNVGGRWTWDGRPMNVYGSGDDAALPQAPRPLEPAVKPAAEADQTSRRPGGDPPVSPGKKARGKARGVTAGRVAAAGVGVAAMLGLAAQMQVAGDAVAGTPAAPKPPRASSDVRLLRWEHDAYQSHATDGLRYAAAEREPIVLTPHTIVHTVGGGSSGGSGGSAGYSSPSYSAPAAPVASSGGSAPH